MKNFYIICCVITLLISCKTPKESKIKKEQLNGVWVVKNVNLIDRLFNDFKSLKKSDSLKNNQLLNFYHFNGDGTFIIDTGSAAIIKGTYKIDDSVLKLSSTNNYIGNISFTTMTMSDTSKMRLYTDFVTEEDKLVYEFKKVHTGDVMNLDWKQPLPATATEKEIKTKLKSILRYYSSYFKTLSTVNIGIFYPGRVILPFQLYDGGIGLKEPNTLSNDFITIMGSEQNAKTAYNTLIQCFNTYFDYPEVINDLALEYAKVISHLADSVK